MFHNKIKQQPITEQEMNVFEESMQLLESVEAQTFDITKEFVTENYKGIVESNPVIIMESSKSLVSSVKEFFKNLIKKLKEIFSRFLMGMNKYFMKTEDFIRKYRNEIDAANPKFSVVDYEYTIPKSVPNTQPLDELVKDYNAEAQLLGDVTKSDLVSEYTKKIQGNYTDELRARILNLPGKISNGDFVPELRKMLRDNSEVEKTIDINVVNYKQYVNGYDGVKRDFDEVRKTKDRIIGTLNNLERFFSSGATTVLRDGSRDLSLREISISDKSTTVRREENSYSYSMNDTQKISTFFNHKWSECKELTTAMTLAFTNIIEAYRANVELHRKIIFDGLKASNQNNGGV